LNGLDIDSSNPRIVLLCCISVAVAETSSQKKSHLHSWKKMGQALK